MDRPDGRKVLKFDGPSGDEYKVSVTDLPFCVIRYDRHSAVETIQPRLGREEMHPYPRLRRYFPRWGKSALRLPYC